MKNIFSDITEIDRLVVQDKLLSEYELPIYWDIIDNRIGLTVLDLGCNDGMKTVKRFDENHFSKIIGVDILSGLVKQANEKFGDDVRTFYCCDIMSDDFVEKMETIMSNQKIEAFDIINCSFLLMHIERPWELARKLRRFLSDNGQLVVIEADDTQNFMEPDVDGRFAKFVDILSKDPYAGKRDVGETIVYNLKECGYQNIECRLSKLDAKADEPDKKETLFVSYCSFLPWDLVLLRREEPNNLFYKESWEWVKDNYEKLHRQMLKPQTSVRIGLRIYTATR